MNNKFASQRHHDRLGFYLVGDKKIFNKTLALIESKKSNLPVDWVFNDPIYNSIDWSKPIETPLFELYRLRAQQLRNDYDYLALYFSGGADSLNILHAFIDNGIFLDEIVMQVPKPFEQYANGKDRSNANFYSEIQYSAIPILNKYKNKLHPATKVRHQDFSKPLLDLLKKEDWFDILPIGTNLTVSGIGKQAAAVAETHILDLCYQGKRTAQILGVDKPLVWFDGTDYFAYFSDLSAMHSPPVDPTQSEIYKNLYHTEFFYWNADIPEIVVKQAQEIKKYCETNTRAREMIAESRSLHIEHFRPLLHKIIYPSYATVEFQTGKPSSEIIRPMDQWFWATADKTIKDNYLATIEYLKNNIDPNYAIDCDITQGINAHNSKFYKL